MSNIYGAKDSANLTIKKKSTGDLFLYADYATTSENAWTADTVYAKSKDVKAVSWDGNKESTLKVTLEIWDFKWLSMLSGSDFVTGAKNILARDVLTVATGNKITLLETPVTGTLQLFKLEADNLTNGDEQKVGTPASNPNEYSITGKDIILNATSAPLGTSMVAYYLKASAATAKTMTIKSDKFPFNVEIWADTMVKDTDGVEKFVQVHYLNAKAKSNYTLTYSATDITKLDVEFDLLKDSKSTDMVEYTIL